MNAAQRNLCGQAVQRRVVPIEQARFAPEALGAHRIELVYEVEAARFTHGASIAIPLPRAAAWGPSPWW